MAGGDISNLNSSLPMKTLERINRWCQNVLDNSFHLIVFVASVATLTMLTIIIVAFAGLLISL